MSKLSALDIRKAIRKKYSDSRRYAVAEEVGLTTGYSHRRLDMMVLDCYNSNGFRIDGFEIKISTSDLRRELEDPEKHIAFFDVIDYYTLAVPAGVVEPLIDIVPQKWGILIVNEDGTTRYKRKALALEDKKADRAVPRGFLASVARSILERQPAEIELREEYERGVKDGEETANRHRGYMADRVKKDYQRLEEYDKLETRLGLWGKDNDAIYDQFEAFRKIDPESLSKGIARMIDQLKTVDELLYRAIGKEKQ